MVPKSISSCIFRGERAFLRSRVERMDYGALMDRKCARERVTGLRPIDTNLFQSEMDSDFVLCTNRRSNGRSSRIGSRDFYRDSEVSRNFILIK